jgi:hypothetical protein
VRREFKTILLTQQQPNNRPADNPRYKMFFNQDRATMRRYFADAWQRRRDNLPLEPLAMIIADIVAQHPEYHSLLENVDGAVDKDYSPEVGETNPFLHMALHSAIREQVNTNRPAGIAIVHQQLCHKRGDNHDAEHEIMECLVEALWQAQRNNTMPDEQDYLRKLQERLVR